MMARPAPSADGGQVTEGKYVVALLTEVTGCAGMNAVVCVAARTFIYQGV
jgi:hypothetical protein